MSRGYGKVQWGCLTTIWRYEREGRMPTTYNITADIYCVERDRDGNRIVTDAQHVAVKRALEGLQRQGKVIGFRDTVYSQAGDGSVELCHYWMTRDGLELWLGRLRADIKRTVEARRNPESAMKLMQRVLAKAEAIGMNAVTKPAGH